MIKVAGLLPSVDRWTIATSEYDPSTSTFSNTVAKVFRPDNTAVIIKKSDMDLHIMSTHLDNTASMLTTDSLIGVLIPPNDRISTTEGSYWRNISMIMVLRQIYSLVVPITYYERNMVLYDNKKLPSKAKIIGTMKEMYPEVYWPRTEMSEGTYALASALTAMYTLVVTDEFVEITGDR